MTGNMYYMQIKQLCVLEDACLQQLMSHPPKSHYLTNLKTPKWNLVDDCSIVNRIVASSLQQIVKFFSSTITTPVKSLVTYLPINDIFNINKISWNIIKYISQHFQIKYKSFWINFTYIYTDTKIEKTENGQFTINKIISTLKILGNNCKY